MTKKIMKILESLKPGALVLCTWMDASIGKSRINRGIVDVPAKSWGIFMGIYGSEIKHIVIAQNSFQYSDGFFDFDYTSIPLGLALEIKVVEELHVPRDIADKLVECFVQDKNGFRCTTKSRASSYRHTTHRRHLRC